MHDYAQFANRTGHVFRASLVHLSEADARLIAAAPELLAALQAAKHVLGRMRPDSDGVHAYVMAQDAIAKATGVA